MISLGEHRLKCSDRVQLVVVNWLHPHLRLSNYTVTKLQDHGQTTNQQEHAVVAKHNITSHHHRLDRLTTNTSAATGSDLSAPSPSLKVAEESYKTVKPSE